MAGNRGQGNWAKSSLRTLLALMAACSAARVEKDFPTGAWLLRHTVPFPCPSISSCPEAPQWLQLRLWALDGELLLCSAKESFFFRAGCWALLGCSRACRSTWSQVEKEFSESLGGIFILFSPISFAQCIVCLIESSGRISINTFLISAALCQ